MAHQVFAKRAVVAGQAALQPGDFIVTHGSGIFDRLIQTFTRSQWNHAALITSADGEIIEALSNGIKQGKLSKYDAKDYYLVHVELDDEDRSQAVAYARFMNAKHEKYGWLTIAAIAFRILTRLRIMIKIDGTLICSEFVARSLSQGGWIWEKETSLITPADLYNTFVKPATPAAP